MVERLVLCSSLLGPGRQPERGSRVSKAQARVICAGSMFFWDCINKQNSFLCLKHPPGPGGARTGFEVG